MSLRFITKTGAAIREYFEDLAQLRMTVFKEFPYLYEGTLEYEIDYLEIYAQSENSFLFAIYDNKIMVGATTAIPLSDETEELKNTFKGTSFNINDIFYFGESLLLQSYRGQGFGHRFMNEREAHVRSFQQYTHAAFCSVIRAENHLLRPENYRPNDEFWRKRNYIRQDQLVTEMDWLDINETDSTFKSLVFWMKELKSL